jgi:hypothetical protein
MLGGALITVGSLGIGETATATDDVVSMGDAFRRSRAMRDCAPTMRAIVLPVTNEVRTISFFAGVIPDAILFFLISCVDAFQDKQNGYCLI